MQGGKGHAAFATWPLFMPATTYSPTHFRMQYHRPGGLVWGGHSCPPCGRNRHKLRGWLSLTGIPTRRWNGNWQCADRSIPTPERAKASRSGDPGVRAYTCDFMWLCSSSPTNMSTGGGCRIIRNTTASCLLLSARSIAGCFLERRGMLFLAIAFTNTADGLSCMRWLLCLTMFI